MLRANAYKINLFIDCYWIQEMSLFKSFCLKAGGLPQPLKGQNSNIATTFYLLRKIFLRIFLNFSYAKTR